MTPLAHASRPTSLEQLVGQTHLTESGSLFMQLIQSNRPTSLLFWGPPGSGKTTLAKIYAKNFDLPYFELSATSSSIAEIKSIIEKEKKEPLFYKKPIVFLDEIHRYNKAQQDVLLPLLESGKIYLIGATTENPSFSLRAALLSRLSIFVLQPLEESDLLALIERYETTHTPLPIDEEGRSCLVQTASGDARVLYNLIEAISHLPKEPVLSVDKLRSLLPVQLAKYDPSGDGRYFAISALHKSLRGSDVDGALYWLMRMVIAQEDPLYLFRRLLRFASEDVGLADPHALGMVNDAMQAFKEIGMPEGEIFLVQVVIYLALAPKSNSAYVSNKKAHLLAETSSELPPPPWILNAPTSWMKKMGFGKGYQYDHDTKEGISGQEYFPEKLPHTSLYQPGARGFEKQLKAYLEYYQKVKKEKKK